MLSMAASSEPDPAHGVNQETASSVDTVVVMQHTKCGVAGVSDEQLREMTGADVDFFAFDDHAAALRDDIDLLTSTPYLGPLRTVAGFVFDVETGHLHDVARWERDAEVTS